MNNYIITFVAVVIMVALIVIMLARGKNDKKRYLITTVKTESTNPKEFMTMLKYRIKYKQKNCKLIYVQISNVSELKEAFGEIQFGKVVEEIKDRLKTILGEQVVVCQIEEGTIAALLQEDVLEITNFEELCNAIARSCSDTIYLANQIAVDARLNVAGTDMDYVNNFENLMLDIHIALNQAIEKGINQAFAYKPELRISKAYEKKLEKKFKSAMDSYELYYLITPTINLTNDRISGFNMQFHYVPSNTVVEENAETTVNKEDDNSEEKTEDAIKDETKTEDIKTEESSNEEKIEENSKTDNAKADDFTQLFSEESSDEELFGNIEEAPELYKSITLVQFGDAIKKLKAIQSKIGEDSFVFVKLYTKQLFLPGIVKSLKAISSGAGIKSSRVVIQITEKDFINNSSVLSNVIDEIKSNGFALMIDNFQIEDLQSVLDLKDNCSWIRIPAEIVDKAHTEETISGMIKILVDFCKESNITIDVGGVITQEQLDISKSLGLGFADGQLVSTPLKENEFEEFLRK